MILIADSGSTKTDWCMAEKGVAIKRIPTKGMNPFFQSEDEMVEEMKHSLLPELDGKRPEAVFHILVYFVNSIIVLRFKIIHLRCLRLC